MIRGPMLMYWRPRTFLGGVVAFTLGIGLLALLIVLSVAFVAVSLAATGAFLAYRWWKGRSLPRSGAGPGTDYDAGPGSRTSRTPLVIDVKPEEVRERSDSSHLER